MRLTRLRAVCRDSAGVPRLGTCPSTRSAQDRKKQTPYWRHGDCVPTGGMDKPAAPERSGNTLSLTTSKPRDATHSGEATPDLFPKLSLTGLAGLESVSASDFFSGGS